MYGILGSIFNAVIGPAIGSLFFKHAAPSIYGNPAFDGATAAYSAESQANAIAQLRTSQTLGDMTSKATIEQNTMTAMAQEALGAASLYTSIDGAIMTLQKNIAGNLRIPG